ncbi:MAG: HEPN domain-containing protein [Chloroflexota bacterium]|nr:HEPN domain-containing protein [Chloroflexota bacterium]
MSETGQVFLAKAEESLAGAESEFANGRYNNCANRCYYASFQAAIYALTQAGITARGNQWGHDFVQAEFVGTLINRHKLYSRNLRDVLIRNLELRHVADYRLNQVSQKQASRALRRTRDFLAAIRSQGGETI